MPIRFLSCVMVLCVIVAVVGCPRPVWAQDDAKPGVYVDGGASLYILELPDYKPIQSFNYPGGLPPYSLVQRLAVRDDPAAGFMGELTLGVRTATPLFLEVSGRTFEVKDKTNKAFRHADNGADYIGFAPFGDDLAFQATAQDAFVSLRSQLSEHGGRLLLGYTLDLGHGLTLSPFVGGEVMHIGQSYDMQWVTSNDSDVVVFQEVVDAMYRGALAGARLQARLGGYLATFSGSVGRYGVQTDYDGSVYDATAYRRERSLEDDISATALEFSAALSRSWGPWSFGVRGRIRQLSYVPQIVANDRDNTVNPNGRFTRLSGYRSRAYTLGLNVRYSF